MTFGGGLAGAILFAFGLLCIIYFGLPLYTGTAGFIDLKDWRDWVWLLTIFGSNVVGCLIGNFLCYKPEYVDSANVIMEARVDAGWFMCLFRAVGCGLIMTLIVHSARDKNYLPLLFGIPIFILLGFYHSIADASYLLYSFDSRYFLVYGMTVLGNFIGCNLPRLLKYDE